MCYWNNCPVPAFNFLLITFIHCLLICVLKELLQFSFSVLLGIQKAPTTSLLSQVPPSQPPESQPPQSFFKQRLFPTLRELHYPFYLFTFCYSLFRMGENENCKECLNTWHIADVCSSTETSHLCSLAFSE